MTSEQQTALQEAVEAAEVLSIAMLESEAKGANYTHVEQPWQHLTAALQKCYKTEALVRE